MPPGQARNRWSVAQWTWGVIMRTPQFARCLRSHSRHRTRCRAGETKTAESNWHGMLCGSTLVILRVLAGAPISRESR
jgi:hypothetical protein